VLDFNRLKKSLLDKNVIELETFNKIDDEIMNEEKHKISSKGRFKKINPEEAINLEDRRVRGKVLFKDPETHEVLMEKDNLILMRTRVWLLEQLFNKSIPSNYSADKTADRSIALFSVGSGGADVNNAAFTPYSPKFSDKDLGEKVPFVITNPDKENSDRLANDPSVFESLTESQKNKYYITKNNPDGSVYYYGKRFANATDKNPLGDSKGWVIDQDDGSVAFSLKMFIDKTECRGTMVNELGLWLGKYDKNTNNFNGLELASRITFDTESLSSLTKGIEIEYIIYI